MCYHDQVFGALGDKARESAAEFEEAVQMLGNEDGNVVPFPATAAVCYAKASALANDGNLTESYEELRRVSALVSCKY